VTALTLDIGGIRIGLRGLTGEIERDARRRWARFLSDGAPEFELEIEPSTAGEHAPPAQPLVQRDGQRYRVEYGAVTAELDLAARRGRGTIFATAYLADSLVRILTTLLALERDAVLVHSSGVRLDGRVLVCFGPSGVGKTTVASSVPRSEVLCDEMMLLRADGDRVIAAGTPFHGDLGFSQPGEAELHTLVRLHQGDHDRVEPLSAAAATRALLNSILFFCRDEALADRVLDVVTRVCIHRTVALTFTRETHVPTFIQRNLRRDALPAGTKAARA
jgi:hypothetical protein